MEGSTIRIGIAFIGGLASFLSPCVLPLVPGYISLISGVSIDHLKQGPKIGTTPRPELVEVSFGRILNWMGRMVQWSAMRLVQSVVANRAVITNSLAFNAGLSVIFLSLGATAGLI